MSFRIRGKYFFLTYSQCSLEPDSLLLHLLDLKPGCVVRCRVAREHHQDGQPHLHAAIRYADRIDLRSELHFDFGGSHPNVQKCNTWRKVLNYLVKERDLYDYAASDYDEDDGNGVSGSIDFADRVQDFTSYSEWLQFCLSNSLSFGYAAEFWREAQRDTSATILESEDPEQFSEFIGPELSDYEWESERKSYVVRGPTGIGKTSWCKKWAPKPALFVSHIDALRQFRPNYHVSIIFDDVSFCHMPPQTQIHICDYEDTRQIHMRHRVQQIPAGVHKFFTINPPYNVFCEMAAIERRCVFIDI